MRASQRVLSGCRLPVTKLPQGGQRGASRWPALVGTAAPAAFPWELCLAVLGWAQVKVPASRQACLLRQRRAKQPTLCSTVSPALWALPAFCCCAGQLDTEDVLAGGGAVQRAYDVMDAAGDGSEWHALSCCCCLLVAVTVQPWGRSGRAALQAQSACRLAAISGVNPTLESRHGSCSGRHVPAR